MRKDKGDKHDVNYLDYIPKRAVDSETGDDGRIILLRPKFMKGPLAKYLQPHLKRKFFRVSLDEFGSATWEAIDGVRTVGQIADLLFEHFGDAVEPRYERCAKFVGSLHRGAMVSLQMSGTAGVGAKP